MLRIKSLNSSITTEGIKDTYVVMCYLPVDNVCRFLRQRFGLANVFGRGRQVHFVYFRHHLTDRRSQIILCVIRLLAVLHEM